MSFNSVIVTKRNMNKTALIRSHGRKTDCTLLLDSTSGSGLSHGNNLIMATALIALNINRNRIAEPELSTDQQRDHRLQGLKRAPMTSDENSKVS